MEKEQTLRKYAVKIIEKFTVAEMTNLDIDLIVNETLSAAGRNGAMMQPSDIITEVDELKEQILEIKVAARRFMLNNKLINC